MSLLMTSKLLQHVTLPWLASFSQCFDFLVQSNTVRLEVGQIQLNLGVMGKEDPATCSCLLPWFFHITEKKPSCKSWCLLYHMPNLVWSSKHLALAYKYFRLSKFIFLLTIT